MNPVLGWEDMVALVNILAGKGVDGPSGVNSSTETRWIRGCSWDVMLGRSSLYGNVGNAF